MPYGSFQGGGSGSTAYSYYIVANDTTDGNAILPRCKFFYWASTGSDSPVVNWPRIANAADAMTYDILRCPALPSASPGAVYPYSGGTAPADSGLGLWVGGYRADTSLGLHGEWGTGLHLHGHGLGCDFGIYRQRRRLQWNSSRSGRGRWFRPGRRSIRTSKSHPQLLVNAGGQPIQNALACTNSGQTTAGGGYTACLVAELYSGRQGNSNLTATLLSDNFPWGNENTAVTGRLNFPSSGYAWQAHQIVTLMDSNPFLTEATIGYRRPASVNDAWIGTDAPHNTPVSTTMLAIGAGQSITHYIANIGSTGAYPYGGAGWLERLTASLKEFNVPAKFDQSVTLAGLSNGCLNLVSNVVASTGSPCGSGGGGGSVSTVFGRSGAVLASSGDYSVGQVTGAAADSAVVHLANPETITGAKTFTSNVTMSGNLLLPQGSGYVPTVGGIGLDTAAGLPVVNIGGTTQQVALTSSNISGQAGTAVALAAVPTQCSGSFATGIAANGNANCATPDIVQLHETTPPAGIPNWGVFALTPRSTRRSLLTMAGKRCSWG